MWYSICMKKKVHTYSVVLSPAVEGGFTVTVPSLPGCVTEGDTVEEALKNAREAIELTLTSLAEHGEDIPRESAPSVTSLITVPAVYA
jgi:antitoxin HicB